MNIEGARRVMETTSHETANQYLRFGWSMVNQYVVEATDNQPATIRYVLASVRRLEDTRQVLIVADPDDANEYLSLGWKLIDKHVTASEKTDRRNETFYFVLAWQSDDPPPKPGWTPELTSQFDMSLDPDDEL